MTETEKQEANHLFSIYTWLISKQLIHADRQYSFRDADSHN